MRAENNASREWTGSSGGIRGPGPRSSEVRNGCAAVAFVSRMVLVARSGLPPTFSVEVCRSHNEGLDGGCRKSLVTNSTDPQANAVKRARGRTARSTVSAATEP